MNLDFIYFDFLWFGHKTVAPFDIWSIQHFFSGIICGYVCCFLSGHRNHFAAVLKWFWMMIFIVVLWEGFEYWAEIGGLGHIIAKWMAGLEHWSNRFIADPLLVISGGVMYRSFRSKKLLWLAFAITCLWFLINVSFTTCMYIQEVVMQ